jgi:hypothetical protein
LELVVGASSILDAYRSCVAGWHCVDFLLRVFLVEMAGNIHENPELLEK